MRLKACNQLIFLTAFLYNVILLKILSLKHVIVFALLGAISVSTTLSNVFSPLSENREIRATIIPNRKDLLFAELIEENILLVSQIFISEVKIN